VRRAGALLATLGALAACASSEADLNVLYKRGMKAAHKDDWDTAMKDLEAFGKSACVGPRPDRRCREAFLAVGHGRERQGDAAGAWAAFDHALALPPHEKDVAVQEDLARAQEEVADKLKQAADHGPVLVRYKDELPDEYNLRSVTISIDFSPVVTRDKNAAELHSPDFTQLYAGPLPTGRHVLVIDAVHNCKTGQSVPCARSELHRAWAFESAPHEPTTIEVRAFADPAEDGQPARPTAAMSKR
jgi:hypothetical protein